MYQLILMAHILIAIMIIVLVLIQHGKGAEIGAAFGSGASNTLFGSQGTGSFLFKLTFGLALAFFAVSLLLSSMVSNYYHTARQRAMPQQKRSAPFIPVPVDANKGQQ